MITLHIEAKDPADLMTQLRSLLGSTAAGAAAAAAVATLAAPPAAPAAAPRNRKGKAAAAAPAVEADNSTIPEGDGTTDEPEATRDPAADHAAATELLMRVYAHDKGKDVVGEILKKFEVKKFAQIDVTKGCDLLDEAKAAAEALGIAA